MSEQTDIAVRGRTGRKLIVSFGLIVYLCVYVWAVITLGSAINAAPDWVQLIFYMLAGLVWIVPLKPMFGWMNAPKEPE